MPSIDRCRELLGNCELSDDEIARSRTELRALAELAVDAYLAGPRAPLEGRTTAGEGGGRRRHRIRALQAPAWPHAAVENEGDRVWSGPELDERLR